MARYGCVVIPMIAIAVGYIECPGIIGHSHTGGLAQVVIIIAMDKLQYN